VAPFSAHGVDIHNDYRYRILMLSGYNFTPCLLLIFYCSKIAKWQCNRTDNIAGTMPKTLLALPCRGYTEEEVLENLYLNDKIY